MTCDRMATVSALSEHIGSEKLRRPIGVLSLWLASSFLTPVAGIAGDLPTGANIVSGNVTIATPGSQVMNINQGSDRAVVNWNSFSIGQNARVDINQPDANSAMLNRVTGNTNSSIHGQLNSNGQVFLVNPNGVFIGPNGAVKTSGFVASTLDISTQDFERGALRFIGNGNSASVVNQGVISSVRGGYAALIGGQVHNSGIIRVPMGRVGLGAGERITLDLAGDGFMQVALPSDSDDEALEALVTNSGLIQANGGRVEITAATARNAARHAINMSGVIEAKSVGGRSGAIVLGGGPGGAVTVSGEMDVAAVALIESSPRPNARPQQGGEITITGADIALRGAVLDASGQSGGGTIRVGGDYQGGGDLQRALTTFVDAATRVYSDGGDTGNGGRVIFWSDGETDFSGRISARGGELGGDGGFVEVSGKTDLRYRGLADTRAPLGQTGNLLLDPGVIDVDDDAAATINANLAVTNVELDTVVDGVGPGPGDININSAISWTTFNEFRLTAENDVNINASITGTNGSLALDAGSLITTGPGGAVDVDFFSLESGQWQQVGTLPGFNANDFRFDPSAATFLRALGGDGGASPYQLTDSYGVQGVGSTSLSNANFVLVNDINASDTLGWYDFGEGSDGFVSIASFGGTFNGAGYAIDGLYNSQSTDGGLFTTLTSTATVMDLRLTNVTKFGGNGGLLAQSNAGAISNTLVEGSFDGFGSGAFGGMVGTNTGTITDSVANVTIDPFLFGEGTADIGGLAGINAGTITRSNSGSTITADNFSSLDINAGGLVGSNASLTSVVDSYAIASIVLTDPDTPVQVLGGLVGDNSGGAITNSFAATSMTGNGSDTIGGLVGFGPGTVTQSFWDTDVGGLTSAAGTGLTTLQLQDTDEFYATADPAIWDFANVWAPGESGFYPANYSTSPVVFARPDPFSVQYGLTGSATTTGTTSGGATSYVFGPMGDSLDTSGLYDALSFSEENVGTDVPFLIDTTSLTSSMGQDFRVVSLFGAAEITPAPLTITPDDQTKTYGDLFEFEGTEYTLTGELFFEDEIFEVGLLSMGTPETASVTDSPYDITIDFVEASGLDNYDVTLATGLLTVDPALVTVEIFDQTKVYGQAFTFAGTEFSASGFVFEGDSISSVTLTSDGASASAPVSGSPYDINGSDAVGTGLENYSISYVPGTLTVTPAALTVTAHNLSKVYGQTLTFAGTEFDVAGLLFSDSVDSATLSSDGAAFDADVASQGYPIFVSDAVGSGLGNYSIEYVSGTMDVTPAPLTITALDQFKTEGDEFFFDGTEFSVSGLIPGIPEDSVDSAFLFSYGADADATVTDSPYEISISEAEGSGLANYSITYQPGEMFVGIGFIPPPPPPTIPGLPNPTDVVTGGGDNGGAIQIKTSTPVEQAQETLNIVKNASSALEIAAASCGQDGDDVSRYLACLADALDAYSKDLDALAADLPEGLESVGDIIQGAKAEILVAKATAESRLASATTAEEREAIRRDAIGQAQASLNNARTEIRKAISLIRAEDPELVSLQTETVNTIVAAVDNVSIGLSRVVEL